MFYSTLLIAATAFTGFASAQNYSTSGPLSIDPNSVPYATRLSWCRAQQNSCPMLCGGVAQPNTCDSNTLNYTCTCTNGQQPNITNYDQTIPAFVCAQWKGACTAAHPDDLVGQTACQSVTCGSANASDASSSSSSSASGSMTASSTASSTGGAVVGGASSASSGAASATSAAASGASSAASSATSSAAASSSSSAAMALNVAMNYGTGILATVGIAFFGLAL
ncbi:hypothetical protein LTS10_006061 [Elasticomyces elasticus]|nr:hypothetical protein LTS10_006061 [Elasticomyces elasticus]